MLDALRKLGSGGQAKSVKEQAAELQALISEARDERGVLSTMLTQIEVERSKLSRLSKSLQRVDEKTTGTAARLDDLGAWLGRLESRTKGFEQLDARIQGLVNVVGQAEQTAEELVAPGGELQKHRHAVQQLSTQALQTNANLDTLKKEQATLDQLRERMRQAQMGVKEAEDHTVKVKSEVERLRPLTAQLHQEHGKLKDGLREAREDAHATTEAIKDVEKKLIPLGTLNELSKSTEERLTALNGLTEHVLQKLRCSRTRSTPSSTRSSSRTV